MRTKLKDLKESGNGRILCSAKVGKRHSSIRFGGKKSFQKMLLDIEVKDHDVAFDHMVMTVGKEIPAIPIVYSRIMPGNSIEFLGEITKYHRRDGTQDYGIKMVKLVSSQ